MTVRLSADTGSGRDPSGPPEPNRLAETGVDEDLFEALDLAECLELCVCEIKHDRRQRALTLYYGLGEHAACSLQVIAQAFGVSREAARQTRDRAVAELMWRAMADATSGCATLVARARRMAGQFARDPVGVLDAFEEGPGGQHPREWAILVLCLAGRPRRTASRLVARAFERQRELLLVAKLDRRASLRERRARERRSAKAERFIDRALWPATTRWDWKIDGFRARRAVRPGLGHSGTFHSDKLGRDVQYESGLELAFFGQLESLPSVVGYQEQPLVIDYILDGRPAVYIPDVLVIFDDGRALVVEIKPRFQMALAPNLRKWVALARWCGREGAGLLIGDGRVSISEQLLSGCPADFADRLLESLRLHNGTLTYGQYRYGVGRDRSIGDLAAAVGAGVTSWQSSPFLLRLPTPAEASDALAFTELLRSRGPASRADSGRVDERRRGA
jgi:hypothetical protein